MLLLSVGTALPTRSSFLSTLISFTLSQSLVTYESMKTRNSQARNYLARKLFFLLKQNGTITKWQFEIRTKRSFMIIYSSFLNCYAFVFSMSKFACCFFPNWLKAWSSVTCSTCISSKHISVNRYLRSIGF